jgi:hypothetical protein
LDEETREFYTALVLDADSRARLLAAFAVPEDWENVAHHMTINIGRAVAGPAAELLGEPAGATVRTLGRDERVMAAGVESSVPSDNAIKHVTIAVNRHAGGKSFHSNEIETWDPAEPFELHGLIKEVARD